ARPHFRGGPSAAGIGAGLAGTQQATAGRSGAPAARGGRPSGSMDAASLVMLLVILGGIGVAVIPPLFFYRTGSLRSGWTGQSGGWGGPLIGGGFPRGGSSRGGFRGGRRAPLR